MEIRTFRTDRESQCPENFESFFRYFFIGFRYNAYFSNDRYARQTFLVYFIRFQRTPVRSVGDYFVSLLTFDRTACNNNNDIPTDGIKFVHNA